LKLVYRPKLWQVIGDMGADRLVAARLKTRHMWRVFLERLGGPQGLIA
jgi:hypothetical protein